jgi:transcriptional repressor NrdR
MHGMRVFPMICPYCDFEDSQVLETRDASEGVHRRRRCKNCQKRFNTLERIEIGHPPMVIKRDGRREPFNREKLVRNVQKACEKRPLPVGEVERLVDDIEQKLVQQSRLEVSSHQIGEMVMDRLRKLDRIAYVRFASVYLNLANLDDLMQVVERLRYEEPPEN